MTAERPALLVIDMQNAYCHPRGALAQAGADVAPMQAVVPRVRDLIRACRAGGAPIVWALMEQSAEDHRHRAVPAHMRARRKLPLCLKGSWDAELIAELRDDLDPADHVVRKADYSAFYQTDLEPLLRRVGARDLFVCGVASNVCVESTVRDAFFRGFEVLLVEDAVAASFAELHSATIMNTRLWFGDTITVKEIAARFAVGRERV